jgi:hypothetical protein
MNGTNKGIRFDIKFFYLIHWTNLHY